MRASTSDPPRDVGAPTGASASGEACEWLTPEQVIEAPLTPWPTARDRTSLRSSAVPVSLRSLASTHPYSASFLLGSTMTLTFVSAARLTKSVFFASRKALPAAALSRAESVWAGRLQQAEQRLQAALEAERTERAVLATKLEQVLAATSRRSTALPPATPSFESTVQSVHPPEQSSTPTEPASAYVMASERWPSPAQSSARAADAGSAPADGIAASREWHPGPLFDMAALARDAAKAEAERPPVKTKYPVARHVNLSRGFGRGGPLPVVDASNPNYIT